MTSSLVGSEMCIRDRSIELPGYNMSGLFVSRLGVVAMLSERHLSSIGARRRLRLLAVDASPQASQGVE
eukprot:4021854-Prorocentrum_lima.AAC.1